MNSIVRDLLTRATVPPPPREAPRARPPTKVTADDEELEKVLRGLKTTIKVFGCGGAGCNTVNRLASEGITGADLYSLNTDAAHLLRVHAHRKILLGRRLTRGLGAGAIPKVGEDAAKESEEDIRKAVQGADMVFVTCGLGGGTGTGSAPVVARLAKEAGALSIGICTLPFKAEGLSRMENAEYGLEKLRRFADTVITIPNDKILELVPRLPIESAFRVADEVLMRAIKGITEIITKPGLVNLDFNDIKTIMKGGGVAMIGLGESQGEDRALEAIEEALNSPLIDVDITGAQGALVNVMGGHDMTISEAEKVSEIVASRISPNARVIWGASLHDDYQHMMRVMVIITGVRSKHIVGPDERLKGERAGLDMVT